MDSDTVKESKFSIMEIGLKGFFKMVASTVLGLTFGKKTKLFTLVDLKMVSGMGKENTKVTLQHLKDLIFRV